MLGFQLGGFNLFWGLTISTIISTIGVIIIARLLSASEYGTVIMPIYHDEISSGRFGS